MGEEIIPIHPVKFVYVEIFRNNRLFNFLKMLKFSIHLNLELYII